MLTNAADALKLLQTRVLADDAVRRAYLDGDHWQQSTGWSGPRPATGEAGEQAVLTEIQSAFTVRDALNETLNRHTSGVIGRAPRWRMQTPNPSGEPTPEPTLDALLTTWWNAADVELRLRTFVQILRSRGRGVLRLFVPAALRDQPLPPDTDPVAAWLTRIQLDVPDPTIAGVVRHTATWMDVGLLVIPQTGDDAYSSLDGQTLTTSASGSDVLETVTLDDRGLTVITQIGGQTTDTGDPLDLGRRLTMREWTLPPLWTPAMLSLQKLLNLAVTMLGRNVIQGGFLERIITNAQLPGRFERDTTTGKDRFIPDPIHVGAGTTNFFAGLPLTDPVSGETKGYANPGVYWRDPAPVDTFTATRDAAYQAMLEEAQQVHALLSGETGVSSESRRQALADYETSLNLTAPIIRSAVAWLLETAHAWALALARQAPPVARADVSVQLTLGPLTQADADLATTLVNGRIWSRERGMAYTQVEDTDAEAAQIAAEAPADSASARPDAPTMTTPAGTGTATDTDTSPQGGATNATT